MKCRGRRLRYLHEIAGVAVLAGFPCVGSAFSQSFGIPLACDLGRDCFVQQFADMRPGPGSDDPFCGPATYDGHDGTDFRIRSLRDMAVGVDVLAVADGVVVRTRNSELDRLIRTESDREAVAGRECGNGLVLDLVGDLEVQYCHLKRNSIIVSPGDAVKSGQRLGQVGISGLTQFPHVHLTTRRAGEAIDPVTGRPLAKGCRTSSDSSEISLFAADILKKIGNGLPQPLACGLSDRPVNQSQLELEGAMPSISEGAQAVVGWCWLMNPDKGDQLTLRLLSPDGFVLAENVVAPLERPKATFVTFAGRNAPPKAGDYTVRLTIVRDDYILLDHIEKFPMPKSLTVIPK